MATPGLWTSVAVASLVLLAHPARAEGLGPVEAQAPPVEDLVARALERSPTLDSLKARYFAALRAVRPAGALPDPTVEVAYRSEGRPWEPMRQGSMAEVMVSQPLFYPGKRAARREEAHASAQVAEAMAREWTQRLIALVRTQYARLYALDREAHVLRASSDLLDLLEGTVASRYAAGQADQEALIRVQMERLRLKERLVAIRAEREHVVASLQALLNEPLSFTLGPVTSLPEVSLPEPGRNIEEEAIAYCCIVAVARAQVEAARRKIAVARLEKKPDFFVGLGAGSTLVPEPVFTVRLGVQVPFWATDKQEPRIEEAMLELEAAEAELREREAMVRSEVRWVLARLEQADETRTIYREGLVAQASLALDAALAAYRAGTGVFLTVVENFKNYLDAQVALARAESERYMAWADLQELITPIPSITEDSP